MTPYQGVGAGQGFEVRYSWSQCSRSPITRARESPNRTRTSSRDFSPASTQTAVPCLQFCERTTKSGVRSPRTSQSAHTPLGRQSTSIRHLLSISRRSRVQRGARCRTNSSSRLALRSRGRQIGETLRRSRRRRKRPFGSLMRVFSARGCDRWLRRDGMHAGLGPLIFYRKSQYQHYQQVRIEVHNVYVGKLTSAHGRPERPSVCARADAEQQRPMRTRGQR